MSEEYGNIPDAFYLSQKEIDELRKSKQELTEYGQNKIQELMKNQEPKEMKVVAEKCVAAARRAREGNPTLGKLLREGRNPEIAKTLYEYGALLRESVNELQEYGAVDVIKLYDLANTLETLDKPSQDSCTNSTEVV